MRPLPEKAGARGRALDTQDDILKGQRRQIPVLYKTSIFRESTVKTQTTSDPIFSVFHMLGKCSDTPIHFHDGSPKGPRKCRGKHKL